MSVRFSLSRDISEFVDLTLDMLSTGFFSSNILGYIRLTFYEIKKVYAHEYERFYKKPPLITIEHKLYSWTWDLFPEFNTYWSGLPLYSIKREKYYLPSAILSKKSFLAFDVNVSLNSFTNVL